MDGDGNVPGGQEVRLEGMAVTYPNGFTAVRPTDLVVKAGEFFSILGPSGCGKTTILRAISGFVDPSGGRILIGGADQAGLGPNERPTALIFQNLALFPLMSVRDNVAFGLEARGVGKRARHAKADALLDLVALPDQADKKPGELSGGQRQRVAIARALAVEPSVLLLDEPLSALDLKLRQHMRAELRSIQKKSGVTFIYITHDQGEALTMSDRIAVMRDGVVEQVGSGDDIYAAPNTAFVASFVGEANMQQGRISRVGDGHALIETTLGAFEARNPQALPVGAKALLFVRPEAIRLSPAGAAPGANCIEARLVRRDLEGPFLNLFFDAAGRELAVHAANDARTAAALNAPRHMLSFAPEQALVLPDGPMASTGRELAAS